jgi:hypothetical protein
LTLKENCVKGKFKTTKHMTVMEQLRVWAERLRRQGRLKEEEMETTIEEMKKEADVQGGGGQNNDATRLVEHQMVLEAVNKGLLQVQGICTYQQAGRDIPAHVQKCQWI